MNNLSRAQRLMKACNFHSGKKYLILKY